MNEEYEYSFKVKNIKDFLDYCENNNYKKQEEYFQTRTLYKNGGAIMARITENEYEEKSEKILNFKDDNLNDKILKTSRESKDLIINKDNEDFVMSLIEILNLNTKKVLKRKRYVYEKENVKFEIDEYVEPLMNVIAIEGKKEETGKENIQLHEVREKFTKLIEGMGLVQIQLSIPEVTGDKDAAFVAIVKNTKGEYRSMQLRLIRNMDGNISKKIRYLSLAL